MSILKKYNIKFVTYGEDGSGHYDAESTVPNEDNALIIYLIEEYNNYNNYYVDSLIARIESVISTGVTKEFYTDTGDGYRIEQLNTKGHHDTNTSGFSSPDLIIPTKDLLEITKEWKRYIERGK